MRFSPPPTFHTILIKVPDASVGSGVTYTVVQHCLICLWLNFLVVDLFFNFNFLFASLASVQIRILAVNQLLWVQLLEQTAPALHPPWLLMLTIVEIPKCFAGAERAQSLFFMPILSLHDVALATQPKNPEPTGGPT